MSRLRPNTSAIAPVTGAVKATARVLAVMIVLIWAAVAPNSRESSGNSACGEYRLRKVQNPLIAMARRRRSKVIRSNALGVETHYARGGGRKHHAVSARTGRAGRMARNHIPCRPQGSVEVARSVDLGPLDLAERVVFLLADDRRVGVGGVTRPRRHARDPNVDIGGERRRPKTAAGPQRPGPPPAARPVPPRPRAPHPPH